MFWLTLGEKIFLLKGRVASNQTALKKRKLKNGFQTTESCLKEILKENCFKCR